MNQNTKNYLAWSIRIVVAFLFLISAVAKMYPSPYFAISTFEVKQLYPLGFSEDIAPYFSRILIGIEFALGLLLLQNHFLRRLIVPATFLMLVVFTTHLSIQTFLHGGNTGNCGCFGSLLPMTPIQAILKNVVAMILLGFLLYVMPKKSESHCNFWFPMSVLLAAILMVFMLAPIQPVAEITVGQPAAVVTDSIPETEPIVRDTVASKVIVPTESAKVGEVKTPDAPPPHKSGYAQYFPSIDKGKKTLCFFVPGCDHCREAAKELTQMKQKDKNFPDIDIIFMNEEADLIPDFFKAAGAEYPYKVVEIIPFWKLLGQNKDTPGVKYLWNGNEYVYYWGINENKFNAGEYQKWVKKPYSELKK